MSEGTVENMERDPGQVPDVSYFAYGSNLSVDQKVERTGSIRVAIAYGVRGCRLGVEQASRARSWRLRQRHPGRVG